MALSLAEQWTLVACGVMAHADGVMDGEEVDRLMSLVDDRVDGDEYSAWLATISDPQRLEELLASMERPGETCHREILEQAWTLAIVDGERVPEELATLRRIAERLGIESVQLDFWLDAWTAGQESFADAIARTVAVVLGGGAPVFDEDRKIVGELLWRLPTSNDHREQLAAIANTPQSHGDVSRMLSSLPRGKRNWLFRLIAPTIRASIRTAEAQRRFVDLGRAIGLDEDRVTQMLAS